MKNSTILKKEAVKLLNNSGWSKKLVVNLKASLKDFLSQAFCEAMLNGVKISLDENREKKLILHWDTERLDTYVYIYPDISAVWELAAGKREDDKFEPSESVGLGGAARCEPFRDDAQNVISENIEWAYDFYYWLEQYQ